MTLETTYRWVIGRARVHAIPLLDLIRMKEEVWISDGNLADLDTGGFMSSLLEVPVNTDYIVWFVFLFRIDIISKTSGAICT
jgi:hypothetical protein